MRFEHALVKSADLESTLFLESTWREIIENKNLTKTQIHIQESIWEIFATERSYMKGLREHIIKENEKVEENRRYSPSGFLLQFQKAEKVST